MTSQADNNDDFTMDDSPRVLNELLAAYDEQVSADDWLELSLPDELQERFALDRKCLDLLHRAWPRERPPEPETVAEPPKELGDFRIVREIGRGGMGVVYEAEQLSLGRRVALKVLPFASLLDEKAVTRFRNEARAAATLEHTNIVPVFAVGEDRGVYYYAMAYIRGRTLAEIVAALRQKSAQALLQKASSAATLGADAAPPATTWNVETHREMEAALSTLPDYDSRDYVSSIVRLMAQAAKALHHAHERGIVHRDIKPGNLMLDETGKIWVTDFGLARIESEAGVTKSGDILGTLRYMAPEQADGRTMTVDHRADIYSLGLTLYQLLVLKPAFTASERGHLLRQIEREDPPPLRRQNPSIPVDLETVVEKAISKDPKDRYDSAEELADDLERVLERRPILAKPPGLISRIGKWTKRHVAAVWAIVFVLLTGVAALAVAKDEISEALSVAETERDSALYNLYTADIRLAQREWEDANMASVRQLLEAHVPPVGARDLRGWEWYYLNQLCHQEVASLDHESIPVDAIGYSPDGRYLASGRSDRTLCIWDVTASKLVAEMQGHQEYPEAVEWSPDGTKIASVAREDALRIWDATRRKELKSLPECSTATDVRWSPDGTKLATSHNDCLVCVWDSSTGEKLQEMQGDDDTVWEVAWSPDGSRLAAVGNWKHQAIRIWDPRTGEQINSIVHAHAEGMFSVDWSPDGSKLATASVDSTVKLWNTDDWTLVRTLRGHSGMIRSVVWNRDGRTLATGGGDGLIIVWDVDNSTPANVLRGHHGKVVDVDWSSDGQTLASASLDGTAKIWRPHEEQRYRSIDTDILVDHNRGISSWGPDGNEVAIVIRNEKRKPEYILLILDVRSNGSRTYGLDGVGESDEVERVTWSPDGRYLAVVARIADSIQADSIFRNINVYDANSMRLIRSMKSGHSSGVWCPDSLKLATCAPNQGVVRVWNIELADPVADLESVAWVDSIAWSPDGKFVAANAFNSTFKVWETGTWSEVLNRIHNRGAGNFYGGDRMLAWTHDSKRLAIGSSDGSVSIWNVAKGEREQVFPAHAEQVRSLAISPNSARIATGGRDRTVKIWDMSGRQLLTLHGHNNPIDDVSWSPDGTHLITSSAGEPLRIWSAAEQGE